MSKKAIAILCLVLNLSILSVPVHATGYYGKKLKGNERLVYESLEKAGVKKLKKCTENKSYIKLKKGVTGKAIYQGWMSYDYDHPEFYWAQGYYTRGYNNKYRYIRPNHLYYRSITKDYKTIDKELNAAIRYVKKKKGRYNKVKSAHDYINRLVDYGYQVGNESHYSIAGMIKKNGRLLVCSGYARLFQAICLANNIPCLYVTGQADNLNESMESHAWNYVQMPDKKWYLVDCTWDDEDEISYEYFLKGSEDENDYGYPISSTHKPSKVAERSGKHQFKQKLPALAKTEYNTKPEASYPQYTNWDGPSRATE